MTLIHCLLSAMANVALRAVIGGLIVQVMAWFAVMQAGSDGVVAPNNRHAETMARMGMAAATFPWAGLAGGLVGGVWSARVIVRAARREYRLRLVNTLRQN